MNLGVDAEPEEYQEPPQIPQAVKPGFQHQVTQQAQDELPIVEEYFEEQDLEIVNEQASRLLDESDREVSQINSRMQEQE